MSPSKIESTTLVKVIKQNSITKMLVEIDAYESG